MAKVVIEQLVKVFPGVAGTEVRAVDGIDLTIEDREFMVLVGPSGCGKSTTLRMIAGLESVTAGTIRIDGRVVNDAPPKDRDIAMVFQNYALYPHLSVRDNLAFGLKLRHLPAPEITRRVHDAAQLLGIEDLLERRPKSLSGGQRQRVAVGRALVRKPKVFLFDEPLSNLDAKLRVSTRTELSKLHARLGATMLYVTHDQVEAMTMGDRICVMNGGAILQVAAPLELYHHPANLFVAGFIGSPAMNFLPGTIEAAGTTLAFVEEGNGPARLRLALDERLSSRAAKYQGRSLILGVRPEDVQDALSVAEVPPGSRAEVEIEVAEPLGAETFLYLTTGAHPLVARVRGGTRYEPGERLKIAFRLENAHLFDPQTQRALH